MTKREIIYIASVIGIVVFIVFMFSAITIVSSGEVGVVSRLGKLDDKPLTEGFNFVNPFTTQIKKLSVGIEKLETETTAASKDLQSVTTKIAVNYQLDPNFAVNVYRNFRNEYTARIIIPSVQESVKAATSSFTAEELITKREVVRDNVKNNLADKLNPQGFNIIEVNIVDFDFSIQFNAAIEAKVTAEQKAKEAENKLKQVQFEAQQSIEKAKAEAESIRLQSNAADNDKYIKLKELEVQQKFAEKWNGQLPQNVYAGAPLPILNMMSK